MALTLTYYPKHKEKQGEILVILIHGLGAADNTWINEETDWINLLLTDPDLPNIDVAMARYDTAHVAFGLLSKLNIKTLKIGTFKKISISQGPFTDIKTLAQELKRELSTKRAQRYKKIIIVGHSMGGLIGIRYILEEIEHNQPLRVKGFISLATPFNGATLAFYNDLFKKIHKHAQIPSLTPNSIFLDDTIRLWKKHEDKLEIDYSFCFGTQDTIVTPESALPHVMSSKWRDSIPLPGDHSTILYAKDHEAPVYKVVSESIQRVLEEDLQLKKKRQQILDEEECLLKARCLSRWQATGLSREKAIKVFSSIDYDFQDIEPSKQRPLSLVVGDFGAGKSLVADLIYQKWINEARENEDLNIPIYLKASPDISNLKDYIEKIIHQNQGSKEKGVSIIIDGLDEVNASIALQILDEARIIVEAWEGSKILLMSRPMPILLELKETIKLPNLKEDKALELVSMIAERDINIGEIFSWPEVIKDAIKRPLFAILLGLYLMDENFKSPRSTGDLLTHLIQKSISRMGINDEKTKTLLEHLAVLSTDRGNVPVSKHEIGTSEDIALLINTKLVIENNGLLSFALPIFSQWFAAQAILTGVKDITDLTTDLATMEYWKYPLVIFVSFYNHKQVEEKFNKIVEANPAFAAEIVEEGLARWGLSDDIVPPPALESGKRIHTAMKSWIVGIGPLAQLIAPLNKDGNILPLGVSVKGGSIVTSWYRGNKVNQDIMQLPNEIHPFNLNSLRDWPEIRSARPGKHSTWAWRWSLEELQEKLSKLLQKRLLPINSGPILKEELWEFSLKIMKKGSLYNGKLPIDPIYKTIIDLSEETNHVVINNRVYNLLALKREISLMKESGVEFITNPWPGPDLEDNKRRWVWSQYSRERLQYTTSVIYFNAIIAYIQIVEELFPNLKNRLLKYSTFPAIFRGSLFFIPKDDDDSGKPVLSWYLDPLPKDQSIQVLIEISERDEKDSLVESDLKNLFDKLRTLRPESAGWISAQRCEEVLDIFHPTPVREIVYDWLWNDLKKISWVKGILGMRPL
jgi:predicted esterase